MSSFAEPSRLKVILDRDDDADDRLEAVRAVSQMLLESRVSRAHCCFGWRRLFRECACACACVLDYSSVH